MPFYKCISMFQFGTGHSRDESPSNRISEGGSLGPCLSLLPWAHNPKVGGSNPPPATKILLIVKQLKGSLQLGKRDQKFGSHEHTPRLGRDWPVMAIWHSSRLNNCLTRVTKEKKASDKGIRQNL